MSPALSPARSAGAFLPMNPPMMTGPLLIGSIPTWRTARRCHHWVSGILNSERSVLLPSPGRSTVKSICWPRLVTMLSWMLSSVPSQTLTGTPLMAVILSPRWKPAFSLGLPGSTQPTEVVGMMSAGLPKVATPIAAVSASRKENSGPAKATMILSSGVIGGSGSRSRFPPSIASIGAIWGRATKPPAGIQPRPYCTPLMVLLQIGFPNQIWKRSILSPRHFAAQKCPSSWTKIIRLKIRRTTITRNVTKRASLMKVASMGLRAEVSPDPKCFKKLNFPECQGY